MCIKEVIDLAGKYASDICTLFKYVQSKQFSEAVNTTPAHAVTQSSISIVTSGNNNIRQAEKHNCLSFEMGKYKTIHTIFNVAEIYC